MKLVGPMKIAGVFFYVLIRKLRKLFNGYSIELYQVQTFIQRYRGFIKKEGHDPVIYMELTDRPWSFTIRKNSSDAAVFLQVFKVQEYQPLVSFIQSFKGIPIKTIIDAGANVGYTSIYFLTKFPNARIIAVEADPGNMEALKVNFANNGVTNFVALQKALWKSSTQVELTNSFRDHREWSRQVSEATGEPVEPAHKLTGISLSDLVQQNGINEIDILKIDIEGAEKEVFSDRGHSITILKTVKFIVVELHDEVEFKNEFEDILRSAEFVFTYFGESLMGFNTKLLK